MSYKFNLDHTLAIADIHDMITIDIKPETRCVVAGEEVEVQGYLTFRGSYLTPELAEELFEGSIPVDITLPYLGGAPDVQPEVVSFDYRVENKESLTLSLEVSLKGYHVNEPRENVMDAWVDPVVEEPVYEEAVIEPFVFDTTTLSDYDTDASYEGILPLTENVLDEEEDTRVEVAVEELERPIDEEVDTIPYSPLVETREQIVEIEEIHFESELVDVPETATVEVSPSVVEIEEAVKPLVEEELTPVVEEVEERSAPKITDSAAALMEELFAMKRGTAFKEKMGLREEVPAEAEVLSAEVEAEEDISEDYEPENCEPVVAADSVARQFADGEMTIKMVYVDDDLETLGGVLERYEATLDDVWNLEELADGVDVGDCVMLRYEKIV